MIRRFIEWIRNEPPEPPRHEPPFDLGLKDSAEDWQVGDIAVCIENGIWVSVNGSGRAPFQPRKGERFTVIGIEYKFNVQLLRFAEAPIWECHSVHFRKLRWDKSEDFEHVSQTIEEPKPIKLPAPKVRELEPTNVRK